MSRTLDAVDRLTRRNTDAVKVDPLTYYTLDELGERHYRYLCPYCKVQFASKSDREGHMDAWHKDEEA